MKKGRKIRPKFPILTPEKIIVLVVMLSGLKSCIID
jgi:hypothetical protein